MSEQLDTADAPAAPAEVTTEPRRGVSVDWIAVAVGAVFAVLAATKLLPTIPWDTVTIPLIK